MFTRVTQLAIVLVAIVMFVAFDSGSSLHGLPEGRSEWYESIGNSVTGVFGMYELQINPSEMSAELINLWTNYGGTPEIENFPFFTIYPDSECFQISSINYIEGSFILSFYIKHPVEPEMNGEPYREDLDIFNLTMIIAPKERDAVEYPQSGVSIYEDAVLNADGYTREMQNLVGNSTVMPYVLVVDDSEFGIDTNNKLAMGEDTIFDVVFPYDGEGEMRFYLYLTAGFGISALGENLLTTKYYNPEFNCKAPWKITASPLDNVEPPINKIPTWTADDNVTEHMLVISVYDWQIGASVYEGDDFADADINEIQAASGIESITIDIPAILNEAIVIDRVFNCGEGMPGAPLMYFASFANEKLAPIGNYKGLVTVTDSRVPPESPDSAFDIMLSSPDGESVDLASIPEFKTYCSIDIEIQEPTQPGCDKITGSIVNPPGVYKEINDGDTVNFEVMAVSQGRIDGIGRYYVDYDYRGGTFTIDDDKPQNLATGKVTFTNQFNRPVNAYPYNDYYFKVVFAATDTCIPTAFTPFAHFYVIIKSEIPQYN